MRRVLLGVGLLSLVSHVPVVLAQEGLVYGDVTGSADGSAPNSFGLARVAEPPLEVMSAIGSVGGNGSVGWSHGLPEIPSLVPAAVSLSYSSADRLISDMGVGWSIQVGPAIRELAPAAREGAFRNVEEDVVSVSGGGLGGYFVAASATSELLQVLPEASSSNFPYQVEGQRYEYHALDGAFAFAWYLEDRNGWLIRNGTEQTLLLAAGGTWTPSAGIEGLGEGCDVDPDCAPAISWVPVLKFDTSGNMTTLDWENGRLVRVETGGFDNGSESMAPTGFLHFEWEDRSVGSGRITYAEGVRMEYAKRLIEVALGPSGEPATRSVYVEYAVSDGVDVVAKIREEGTDGSAVTVAEFEYEEAGVRHQLVPLDLLGAPFRLLSSSMTVRAPLASDSLTTHFGGLIDLNGDARADAVAFADAACAGGTDFQYARMNVDGDFETPVTAFSDCSPLPLPASVADLVDPGESTDAPTGVGASISDEFYSIKYGYVTRTYTTRSTVDLNGDGYIDMVESRAIPNPDRTMFEAITNNSMNPAVPFGNEQDLFDCYGNLGCQDIFIGYEWKVWLGTPDGDMEESAPIVAPVPFLGVEEQPRGCSIDDLETDIDPSSWGNVYSLPSEVLNLPARANTVVQLIDMNGDRRLDIVYLPGADFDATFDVYASSPTPSPEASQAPLVFYQKSGWENINWHTTVPRVPAFVEAPLALFGSDLWADLWSTDWEQRRLSRDWLAHYVANGSHLFSGTRNITAMSCAMEYVDRHRDFVDINSDGFMDFVVGDGEALHTTVAGEVASRWVVYFGTPNGMRNDGQSWSAPIGMPIGRSYQPLSSASIVTFPIGAIDRSAVAGIVALDLNGANPSADGQCFSFRHCTSWEKTVPVPGGGTTTETCSGAGNAQEGCECVQVTEEVLSCEDAQQGSAIGDEGIQRGIPIRTAPVVDLNNRPEIDDDWDLPGTPGQSVQQIGLLDVDGDGMLDLVKSGEPITETVGISDTGLTAWYWQYVEEDLDWYRSTGASFEREDSCSRRHSEGRCGEWSVLSRGLSRHTESRTGVKGSHSEGIASQTGTGTLGRVGDFNGDGLPDIAEVRWFATETSHGTLDHLDLSVGNRPGLLKSVRTGTGGKTHYAYIKGALTDVGRTVTGRVEGAVASELVSAVYTRDPITGYLGRQRYDYQGFKCEGGVCPGFARTTVHSQMAMAGDGASGTVPGGRIVDGRVHPTAGAVADEVDRILPDAWSLDWAARTMTHTQYALTRQGAWPHTRTVYYDPSNAGVPIVGAPHASGIVPEVLHEWVGEFGTPIGSPVADCPTGATPSGSWSAEEVGHCRLALQTSTLASAGTTPLLAVSGLSQFTFTTWGSDRLPIVVSQVAEVPTGSTLMSHSMITYVKDTTGTLARVASIETSGSEAPGGDVVLMGREDFEYDDLPAGVGRGLLTSTRRCTTYGGSCGGGASSDLVWTWTRTNRGVISAQSGPPGSDLTVLDWGMGGTVPTASSNALGHVSEVVLDAYGRTTATVDPNGVTAFQGYDDLGRTVRAGTCGVAGVGVLGPCFLTEETSFSPPSAEGFQWAEKRVGATAVSGPSSAGSLTAAETITRTYFDGFGRPRQKWDYYAMGSYYLVTDSLSDLFGRVTHTTWPHQETQLPTSVAELWARSGADVADEFWYNVQGDPVVHIADKTGAPSCATFVQRPQPWIRWSQDESGRVRSEAIDLAGRPVEIREAGVGTGVTDLVEAEACASAPSSVEPGWNDVTGSYVYDGAGRLRDVTIDETTWSYAYDHLGRLRQVDRADAGFAGTTSAAPYAAYDYHPSGLLALQCEGDVSTCDLDGDDSGAGVMWDHDALGRPISKWVRDDFTPEANTTGWAQYTTTWDARWDGTGFVTEWIGARTHTQSPVDTTSWRYTTGSQAGGFRGAPTSVTREFDELPNESFAYHYAYDELGRVVATTWPSGTEVHTSYVDGRTDLIDVQRPTPGGAGFDVELSIFHDYDDQTGDLADRQILNAAGSDHFLMYAYDRPGRVEQYVWAAIDPEEEHLLGITYGPDSRLVAKTYTSGDPTVTSSLGVDEVQMHYNGVGHLGRVQTLYGSGNPVVQSSFDFADRFGRLESGTQQILEGGGFSIEMLAEYGPYGPFHEREDRNLWAMGMQDPTQDPPLMVDSLERDATSGRVVEHRLTFAGIPGMADPWEDAKQFHHDGTGQLVGMTYATSDGTVAPSFLTPLQETIYNRDADDQPVSRRKYDGVAGIVHASSTELYFQGWKRDVVRREGGMWERDIEHILPFLDLVIDPSVNTVAPQWLLREPEGGVWAQLDDAGTLVSAQTLVGYGMPIGRHAATGDPDAKVAFYEDLRDQYGLHGVEADDEAGGLPMGVRRVLPTGDGTWMQPEPLLHLGLSGEQLLSPRALVGPYAYGAPSVYSDRSGYCIDGVSTAACVGAAVWAMAEVALSAADAVATGQTVIQYAQGNATASDVGYQVAAMAIGIAIPGGGAGAVAKYGDDAMDLVRAADNLPIPTIADDLAGACFVADTEVRTPAGTAPIEDLAEGALVLSADAPASPTGTAEVRLAPLRRSWLDSTCDRLKRAAWRLALPGAVLAACDIGTPPGAADGVDVFAPDTASWIATSAEATPVGGEVTHGGHLFRRSAEGWEDVGRLGPGALADADAAVAEVDVVRRPAADAWVLVLAAGANKPHHTLLADLAPGTRFAFQGRVYEALGAERVKAVQATGEVLGRVVSTFVRTADAVIDLQVGYPDGTTDTLTGTPNHPFWVPAVGDYVALEDLAVGAVLRTYGGSEATVLGLTFVKGDVEVYDVEVEGLHNFFVRGPGSDAAGVLVHNSTKADDVLYHYTDEVGAKGIAESGVIRADDRGRVFLTSDEVSPGNASDALFMGQGGTKGTHRAEVRLKDDSMLTGEGATQPNELIHRGSVRDPRNAEIKVVENDF